MTNSATIFAFPVPAAAFSRFKARDRGKKAAAMLLLLLLAACEVGPDYHKLPAETPLAYKELDGWKQGTPQQAGSDTAWWSIYNDPVLDGLMRQIDISNQNRRGFLAPLPRFEAGGSCLASFPLIPATGERGREFRMVVPHAPPASARRSGWRRRQRR